MKLVIVDGCPCPASIAPYVVRILNHANQSASSIYRGADAAVLLHAHGKHTQAEIHIMYPTISNPDGESSHELRADGSQFYGPRGAKIPEWKIGVDSGTDSLESRNAIIRAGVELGWPVVHPYTRGVEFHHWSFLHRPRPHNPRQFAHIVAERHRMVTQ